MSIVSINVNKPDGSNAAKFPSWDSSANTIPNTNPVRYALDVSSNRLDSSVVYTLVIAPKDYHKVAQVAQSGNSALLARFEMEDGGGGGK